MGKKELKKIIEKRILSGDYRIATGGECGEEYDKELTFVCRQLGILCESAFPFYYSKIGRDVLIVDHVAFDSKKIFSGQDRHFSDLLFMERRTLKKSAATLIGRYKLLPPISKGPGNARSYLVNLMTAFAHHYAQISEYKELVRSEGVCSPSCRMKTCFFIEDTTPLGSYIMSTDGMNELVLFYVKQFLDLFERSSDLDYAFFGCFKGRSNTLWFMKRKDLIYYRKQEIDLLKKNYFAFNVKKTEGME